MWITFCYNKIALKGNEEKEGERMVEEESLKLPDVKGMIKPTTEAEIKQLATLGEEITISEAVELSAIFPDIPKDVVEKHMAKSILKEVFLLPKKLQKWRRR